MKENHPTSLMWTPPRNHGLIGDLHPYISAGWYHTLHRWYPPVDQHCNIDMETQRFVVRFLNGRETIVFHIYVGGASHSVNGLHRNSIWDIPYYKWLISGLQTTHPQGKHVHRCENSWKLMVSRKMIYILHHLQEATNDAHPPTRTCGRDPCKWLRPRAWHPEITAAYQLFHLVSPWEI
jgi:hypothetical protein